ncbi:hypothetical protein COY95_04375, partial [Candidatus Woesearchaeota archaeon CG_4_10_14_0_8_um_filter_47_5]
DVTVRVSSLGDPAITATGKGKVMVKDCMNVAVDFEDAHVCPTDTVSIPFTVTNTGKLSDNFKVTASGCPSWLDFETKEYTLDAGKRSSFTLDGTVPASAEGKAQTCTVSAQSVSNSNLAAEATASIAVKNLDQCYCVESKATPNSLTIEQCSNTVIELMAKNCGTQDEKFSVSFTGSAAEWSIVEPKSLVLRPGETQPFYVAVKFPIDAEIKDYELKTTVKGEHSGAQDTEQVTVTAKAFSQEQYTP